MPPPYRLIVASLILFTSCKDRKPAAPATTTSKQADTKNTSYPPDNISAFAGVVKISDTAHYSDGFDFVLYNEDSTVWKELRFSPRMADSAGLMPYQFSYDYDLMIFRCLGQKGSYFRVLVNEKSGLVKLISVREKFLMFQTWPQHLQGVYAVGFDAEKNPLRRAADSLSGKIAFDKEQTFMPEKVVNDWLRVKWGEGSNLRHGWIKWKDAAGDLLVNIFYVE